MPSDAGTERIVAFYADSWIDGDTDAVRRLLAPDAEIKWNLDAPVDDEELIRMLRELAARAESVGVVSRTCTDDRAAVIYDCAGPLGTIRFAEFLAVGRGRITEVRQVHDPVSMQRCFPGLMDQLG